MLLHLPIVILAGLPVTPVADNAPKFDIARECRAESSPDVSMDNCVHDEKQAVQQLQEEWPQFAGVDRSRCLTEANLDGNGSYVEYLTCLEMMRDVRTSQGNQASQTVGNARHPHK